MNLLTVILSAFTVLISDYSPEQIAFDYFFTEIFPANYPEVKEVYFLGQSEGIKSIAGPFLQCFKSDSSLDHFYYQHNDTVFEKIPIMYGKFPSIKKSVKPKSKKLNLIIFRAVNYNGDSYVYIKVFKEKLFVDHYLLKISPKRQESIIVCRKNEII